MSLNPRGVKTAFKERLAGHWCWYFSRREKKNQFHLTKFYSDLCHHSDYGAMVTENFLFPKATPTIVDARDVLML